MTKPQLEPDMVPVTEFEQYKLWVDNNEFLFVLEKDGHEICNDSWEVVVECMGSETFHGFMSPICMIKMCCTLKEYLEKNGWDLR